MSYEYCQCWNEKEKKCMIGKEKCYLSHLNENGKCDGWYFYEPNFETKEMEEEYGEEN